MSGPLQIFIFLGILLLVQSVASLRDGFRFLRYVRVSRNRQPSDYVPRVAVTIPVKGTGPGFEAKILAFLRQDYPQYHVTFVVDDKKDPAFSKLNALVTKLGLISPERASVVIAGACETNGQKVHNLLQALKTVDPETEVLVFADADATPNPSWLRSLVAPLANPETTVSTGFRWYLPDSTFVSQLRAAWDTSIATLFGEDDASFPWGGSMALRARDFERLQVAERYWASTVSDDYSLARAVRDGGGRIRFQPRCLVLSREDSSFAEFLRWTNRQIIITRVYAPRLWRLGLAAHLLYASTLIFGVVLLFGSGMPKPEKFGILAFLALIVALGMAKGRIRSIVARETFPEEREFLAKYGSRYWQLAPLVPWVMLWNFVVAGFTRRIEWCGIRYHLRSDHEVEVIGRGPV
ncbi:MAG: glycosyltransferase family 2 protein [Acidobacteria bacterium]|nr:glycosyltransferase family 2 protein [Acidobacteriota bacterium]